MARLAGAWLLALSLPSVAAAQAPDWKALEAEAISTIQSYVRIDTSNPPGDVTRAEAEMARLTREIEKLDAALADGTLFTRDPGKAAATAKSRAECDAALAKAEEDWLAAGSALEAAE